MIEVKNVNLIRKQTILDNVNLTIEDGLIYGLVGNNGSGKTMLMKCICGFIRCSSGEVLVDNRVIGREMEYLENAGIIIEAPSFIPYYSGYKNLKILSDLAGKNDSDRVSEVLRLCGLDPKLKKHVRKYSLGMRQRLGIAQAIMDDPQYLILDEPMNGLDKNGIEDIRKLLLDEKERGKTIIVASHNKEDIDILCDHVCEMESGRLRVIR